MVRVHPKPRDYLFVAGQRRRTPIMEIEAKVKIATGAGRNPETRNMVRETGMTSQSVSSCRIKKRGKVTNKVTILLTLLVMIVPMMLLSLLLDVLRPMMSGYLTLHALFICAHIEIGLLLLIPLLLLVPFWVLTIH